MIGPDDEQGYDDNGECIDDGVYDNAQYDHDAYDQDYVDDDFQGPIDS